MAGPAELPDDGPTTVETVKVQLTITPDDQRDDTRLTAIVEAVNAMVRTWRVSELAAGLEDWPAQVELGAAMLAARLFRRRNSPAGVESFGQLGAAYVMRNDPDIAQLLRLGTYQSPQLG